MNYSLTDQPKGTTYNGIDLVKFFCSLLIIAVHVPPLYSVSPLLNYGIQQYLARLAVPFFFTASGFFVFRKTSLHDFSFEASLHFTKKMLRLYGTWIAILIAGVTYHLWYMTAAVVAVLLVSFLISKKVSPKQVVLISSFLYVIGLLGDSYYGLIAPLDSIRLFHIIFAAFSTIFSTTRNGVFMGMIYVSIGMIFAYYPIKMKGKYALGGFIVSVLLLLGEVILLKMYDIPRNYNMYVFLVPAIFFLFYIATHMQLKDSKKYAALRVLGALMYYTHTLVYMLVSYFIPFIINHGAPSGIDNSVIIYGTTVICTFILSAVIYQASQTKRFRWLKWLYS